MNKIVLMAMALMWAFTASAQSDVVASYNEGAEALQAKNFAKAVEAFESVIANGSDSADDAELNCVANAKKYLPTAYQGKGAGARLPGRRSAQGADGPGSCPPRL